MFPVDSYACYFVFAMKNSFSTNPGHSAVKRLRLILKYYSEHKLFLYTRQGMLSHTRSNDFQAFQLEHRFQEQCAGKRSVL